MQTTFHLLNFFTEKTFEDLRKRKFRSGSRNITSTSISLNFVKSYSPDEDITDEEIKLKEFLEFPFTGKY